MNNMKVSLLLITATIAALGCATARAEFILVEDFDGLVLGPVDEQAGWTAPATTSAVVLDPADAANQVLSVVTESTFLRRGLLLVNDSTRMLFLRFRFDDQLAVSFGMSAYNYPSQFGDFDVELSLTNAGSELRINDDGNYLDLAVLVPGTWYNCWLLIDNTDDVVSVWLHDRTGEAATAADQINIEGQTTFGFRSAPAGDLRTFFIKTGGGNGIDGPLYLDDIHLETTDVVNLDNPSASLTGLRETMPATATPVVWPNPFNPQTQVRFTLADAQTARIAIYNLRGGVVCVLADRMFAAGTHDLRWQGRDDTGLAVPTGTYLLRLETARGVATSKLALIR